MEDAATAELRDSHRKSPTQQQSKDSRSGVHRTEEPLVRPENMSNFVEAQPFYSPKKSPRTPSRKARRRVDPHPIVDSTDEGWRTKTTWPDTMPLPLRYMVPHTGRNIALEISSPTYLTHTHTTSVLRSPHYYLNATVSSDAPPVSSTLSWKSALEAAINLVRVPSVSDVVPTSSLAVEGVRATSRIVERHVHHMHEPGEGHSGMYWNSCAHCNEAATSRLHHQKIEADRANAEAELQGTRKALAAAQVREEELSKSLESHKRQLEEVKKQLARAEEGMGELRRKKDEAERRTREEAEQRQVEAEEECRRLRKQVTAARRETEVALTEEATLAARRDAERERARQLALSQAQAAEHDAEELRSQLAVARQEVASLQAEVQKGKARERALEEAGGTKLREVQAEVEVRERELRSMMDAREAEVRARAQAREGEAQAREKELREEVRARDEKLARAKIDASVRDSEHQRDMSDLMRQVAELQAGLEAGIAEQSRGQEAASDAILTLQKLRMEEAQRRMNRREVACGSDVPMSSGQHRLSASEARQGMEEAMNRALASHGVVPSSVGLSDADYARAMSQLAREREMLMPEIYSRSGPATSSAGRGGSGQVRHGEGGHRFSAPVISSPWTSPNHNNSIPRARSLDPSAFSASARGGPRGGIRASSLTIETDHHKPYASPKRPAGPATHPQRPITRELRVVPNHHYHGDTWSPHSNHEPPSAMIPQTRLGDPHRTNPSWESARRDGGEGAGEERQGGFPPWGRGHRREEEAVSRGRGHLSASRSGQVSSAHDRDEVDDEDDGELEDMGDHWPGLTPVSSPPAVIKAPVSHTLSSEQGHVAADRGATAVPAASQEGDRDKKSPAATALPLGDSSTLPKTPFPPGPALTVGLGGTIYARNQQHDEEIMVEDLLDGDIEEI